MKSIRKSQFIGLLYLPISIHVHCFSLERYHPERRNSDDARCRRMRISRSYIPLYMYVIEDNHDQRPSRRLSRAVTDQPRNDENMLRRKKTASKSDWREDWGVELRPIDVPDRTTETTGTKQTNTLDRMEDIDFFPSSIEEVTDAAVSAVIMALQPPPPQRRSTTKPTTTSGHSDPNLIQNMVYSDNIMMSRRPVRHPHHDRGRIGIEFDWSVSTDRTTSGGTADYPDHRPDYSTIRYASLLLAGKLSAHKFDSNHSKMTNGHPDMNKNNSAKQQQQQATLRPIAIYCNTVQEALLASRQLRQLKRLEFFRRSLQQTQSPTEENLSLLSSIFDSIYIRFLGEGADIPDALVSTSGRCRTPSSTLSRQSVTGEMNSAPNSMILIVQPTNYLDEFSPPGPLINVIDSIQRLISIAAIEEIPVIMISPRFLKASISSGNYCDQSGYYQESSLYAGLEPPPGPTPWILRDFTPPVFCYVANALSCKISNPIRSTNNDTDNNNKNIYYRNMLAADENRYSYYSHLSLWQSVLHKGHGWNLFAAIRHVPTTLNDHGPQSPQYSYRWIGTSKNSAGRPTRQLMRRIWSEYMKAKTSLL